MAVSPGMFNYQLQSPRPALEADATDSASGEKIPCTIHAIVGKIKDGNEEHFLFSITVDSSNRPWHGVMHVPPADVSRTAQEQWDQLVRSQADEAQVRISLKPDVEPVACLTGIQPAEGQVYECHLEMTLRDRKYRAVCHVPQDDIDKGLLNRWIEPDELARDDGHVQTTPTETPTETATAPETPLPLASEAPYANPASLPLHECILDGPVEGSEEPDVFLLPLKVKSGSVMWNGLASVPDAIFIQATLRDIRLGIFPGIHQKHRECQAKLMEIAEEDGDEYIVNFKLSMAEPVADFNAICRIPQQQVAGKSLQPWLAKTGETIVQSLEEGPDPAVEEASKYNRTVRILGNLAIGERRSMAVRVEVWSWNGQTSIERSAKTMELTKREVGFRVRLRVKMMEKAYMYLSGWVHDEGSGGRFAEETPGELWED